MKTVFDSHCHIFPSKIAEKATDSIGHFYDIPMSEVGSPEALLKAMDEAGVSRSLVCSTATRAGQVHAINRFISEAQAAAKGRFWGFGTLHQDLSDEEMADEIESFSSLGLHGVKLHPDFQSLPIDLPKMLPVYEELARRGLPVLFHIGDDRYDFSSPERLCRVLEKVPSLHAVAAHLGGYRVWDRAGIFRDFKNVIFDCSSSMEMLSKEETVRQFALLGPERVMFGSDFPMWKPKEVLDTFLSLGFDEATRDMVLHGNFEKYLVRGEW